MLLDACQGLLLPSSPFFALLTIAKGRLLFAEYRRAIRDILDANHGTCAGRVREVYGKLLLTEVGLAKGAVLVVAGRDTGRCSSQCSRCTVSLAFTSFSFFFSPV